MKWGRRYGPEYVNVLHRMVGRHLARPHRFVCFTDDAEGLEAGIDARPLPAFDRAGRPEAEAWPKLSLFGPDLGLQGPSLFLDLDVVVVDALDPFFEHPGRFCIIHNWTHAERRIGNSSVFRFTPGEFTSPYRDFLADPARVTAEFPNEQAFLSERIDRHGALDWWPQAWCTSFKKHCLPRGLARLYAQPRIPPGCRIVVFHGQPDPPEAATRHWYGSAKRRRLPKPMRPARWILQHWR